MYSSRSSINGLDFFVQLYKGMFLKIPIKVPRKFKGMKLLFYQNFIVSKRNLR